MSEKLSQHIEQEHNKDASEALRARHETHHASHETTKTPDVQPEELERLSIEAAANALNSREITASNNQVEDQHTTIGMQSLLKKDAYKSTLKRAQHKLPRAERQFSKVIHTPIVESTSNALSSTIGRSAGILGGAITALIGSALLLWASKYYGYTYNYALIFALFIVGYTIGSLIELVSTVVKRKTHS